jgi:hypothetical protein
MNAYLEKPVEELSPFENYYFPDFDQQSCGFGKDYPVSNNLVRSLVFVPILTTDHCLCLLVLNFRPGWLKKVLKNGICSSTQASVAVTTFRSRPIAPMKELLRRATIGRNIAKRMQMMLYYQFTITRTILIFKVSKI